MVMRRCAFTRRPSPEMVEFCEDTLTRLPALPALDERLTERVGMLLQALSSRNRQVLTLHYLDGYTCREIGNILHLTEGTVKRILHESRNALRERLIYPAPAGHKGGRPMTEMHDTRGPRRLSFSIAGNWPGPVMDGLVRQSICLTINKTAKSARQVARDIDAHIDYVMENLPSLVDEVLVTKEGDRYRTAFIALDLEEQLALQQDVRTYAEAHAQAIERWIPEFAAVWENTTLAAQGVAWEHGIWIILSFFFDTGFERLRKPLPEPPLRRSGCRYWAGGHETLDNAPRIWSIRGLNMYYQPDRIDSACGMVGLTASSHNLPGNGNKR